MLADPRASWPSWWTNDTNDPSPRVDTRRNCTSSSRTEAKALGRAVKTPRSIHKEKELMTSHFLYGVIGDRLFESWTGFWSCFNILGTERDSLTVSAVVERNELFGFVAFDEKSSARYNQVEEACLKRWKPAVKRSVSPLDTSNPIAVENPNPSKHIISDYTYHGSNKYGRWERGHARRATAQ